MVFQMEEYMKAKKLLRPRTASEYDYALRTYCEAWLDSPLRDQIRRLSAILRVADGFDRGHVNAVGDLKVRWMQRALRITPTPVPKAKSLRLELWGAARKSALLAELAGIPVEIVGPDGKVVGEAEMEEQIE